MKNFITGIAFIFVLTSIFAVMSGLPLYDVLGKSSLFIGISITFLILGLVIHLSTFKYFRNEFIDLILRGITGYFIIKFGAYIWNIPLVGVMEVIMKLAILMLGFSILILAFIWLLKKYEKD